MLSTIRCYNLVQAGVRRHPKAEGGGLVTTGWKKYLRTVLAGSLLFGVLTASLAVGVLPASAASVEGTFAVGSAPLGVSSDGTHVWVANPFSNSVTEMNATTGAVIRTIAANDEPWSISSDGTHVWVSNSREQRGA